MTIKLLHNPRCSKSRQALALLEGKEASIEVVKYLETPPSAEQLRAILAKLNLGPRDIIRKNETIYKELGLGDADLDETALITAMVAHPILIERPIAISPNRAVVGRPPERVLELLT